MVTLVNRAKVATATTGTGSPINLGAAESGYQTFADAGVTDGQTVRYVIEDGTDWEIGTGTYTASGTTLSRAVVESSNADAAINLTGNAVVFVSATSADFLNYVRRTANYTAKVGDAVIADTSGGAWTLTLPASPIAGDAVVVLDGADWSTNNLTVGRNGSTIEGDAEDMTMDIGGVSVSFVYDGTTWQIYAQVGTAGEVVTLTGTQTLTNKTLTTPTMTGTIVEDVYTISGTSVALEPDNGSVQLHTLTGNTTYTDGFTSGEAITLMIDDGTDYTVTWPTTTWVNNTGAAPTLATTGYTVVALWKVSTTLYGALVGDGS